MSPKYPWLLTTDRFASTISWRLPSPSIAAPPKSVCFSIGGDFVSTIAMLKKAARERNLQ
nr:MAG TPA: hypothetical protein [Caudoviricetes sp.]